MKHLSILFLLLCFTLACKPATQEQTTPLKAEMKSEQKEDPKVGFVHAVYFYLIDDATEADKKKFEQALHELSKVKSIVEVYWGAPADTAREVVDNSYDYAWITLFEDVAGHDAYQIDPIHTKFVKEFEYLFKEVKVYDNVSN